MSIKKTKIENIRDMAITFSSMARVFKKGSKEKIKDHLESVFGDFSDLNKKDYYNKKHEKFCKYITDNIKTSRGNRQNASWGHAAKVIDVVLKVSIYYCKLPSYEDSRKIVPWLNGAIDTKILNYLKREYNDPKISKVKSLKEIDQERYDILQKFIRKDINLNYNEEMYPVQWDDIRWKKFNR